MTDPARLAAKGKPLTLTDGRTVNVRFGFRALLAIEDRFGGIAQMQAALGAAGRLDAPVFGPLLDLIAAGLLDEHAGNGEPFTRERLADLLDPALFRDYMAVVAGAVVEAFPTQAPATPPTPPPPSQPAPALLEPAPAPTTPAETAPADSPGMSGSTSAPSPSVEATTPSGA